MMHLPRIILFLIVAVLLIVGVEAYLHRHFLLAIIPITVAAGAVLEIVLFSCSFHRSSTRAQAGDLDAMVKVALYKIGEGPYEVKQTGFMPRGLKSFVHEACSPTDVRLGMDLLHTAAERGNAAAQLVLSGIYDHGEVVSKDPRKAFYWCRKSAEQGEPSSQVVLGTMYHQGEGIEKDINEAVRWYGEAAKQGDQGAQIVLGTMYSRGDDVPTDSFRAVKWFSAAFNASSLTPDFAREHGSALQWFLSKADLGDDEVMLNVGNLYSSPCTGTKPDLAEASRWYHKAANLGNEMAMCYLGRMCQIGEGVEQNHLEALGWYRKAAEQGNAGAMLNIALMYNRSEGVRLDQDELYFWYYLCSMARLPESRAVAVRKACELLESKFTPDELSSIEERARKWIAVHPQLHFIP